MKAERDKIEAERAENQKMMQELLLMKEKLSRASELSAVMSENTADAGAAGRTDRTMPAPAAENTAHDVTTSD